MDWSVLIVALFDALVECLKERRREKVEAGLNDPGFREAFVLRRLLRDQGLRGRALRTAIDDGMVYLESMTAEDIACLLDDVDAKLREED